jgi:GTP-binding protein LepA
MWTSTTRSPRSLAACEGALLIVDASQGVEAQTLSNTYLALDANLEILPVINKIDLPAADPKRAKQEIEDIIGIPAMDAPEISAKLGLNIDAVMDDIVAHIPAPKGDPAAPLKALVFDSQYDNYRGVIVFIRVFDGCVRKGSNVLLMQTGADYEVLEVGHLRPMGLDPCGELSAGEVGYFTASIKNVADTRIGDTVTDAEPPHRSGAARLPQAQPMVFCGIYTEDGSKYPDLRDALEKLKLNDASLSYEPESSIALGFGFRCGFLGMLHMEIMQERLEREFDLDLVTTAALRHLQDRRRPTAPWSTWTTPTTTPTPAIAESQEPYVKVVHHHAQRIRGQHHALCQPPRRVQGHAVSGHQSGGAALSRCPSTRSSTTFSTRSRPAPRATPRWTTSSPATAPVRAGEGGHAAQRRSGGRAELHRPQGQGLSPGRGSCARS